MNAYVPLRKYQTGETSRSCRFLRLTSMFSWVPRGYGQQNMYMAPHKCRIINTNSGKRPPTPAKVPGPGVKGPKQMIAAFQADGNNVNYKAGVDQVPVYGPSMGYLNGEESMYHTLLETEADDLLQGHKQIYSQATDKRIANPLWPDPQ